MLPAQPNQGLIDGLTCLQAISADPKPIGSRELARRLGLNYVKVNRLLKTLGYIGMVRQTADRKYTTGPGIHVLGAQALFGSGLLQRAIKPLEELCRFGHIVALGVLWRDQVSYLYHRASGVSGEQSIGRVGLYPASVSGVGVPILASMEKEKVCQVYAACDSIPGYADTNELLRDLRCVRQQGYAVVEQPEYGRGHRSLGVAIGKPVYAAVAISGKIKKGQIKTIVKALGHAVELIES